MKKFFTLLLVLTGLMFSYADETDDEINAYLLRQSNLLFKQYVESNGTVDNPQWEDAISSAFTRIIINSGESSFNAVYAIIDDSTFNAACFPGGQFIINRGTLEIFDNIIEKQLSSKKGADISELRENLIAPVIAHELGHYYNKHQFRSYRKLIELASTSPEDMAPVRIQYSIANEYEADYTGYMLLKKAGYDPGLMIVTLEIINTLHQEDLQKGGGLELNQYFQDHPSPHKRLAKFAGNRQEYHQLAAELEKAFDDVQMGIRLERAIEFLEKSGRKFPGNIYISKERAVALHKLWLSTVPVSEQRLKGIIDTPPFRDEMVFKPERGLRRGTEVPGNRKYYEKAYEAYMKIYKKAADPAFDSNFALLLAYSPDSEKRKMALELSYKAAKDSERIDLASNYAVVIFLSGEREHSLQIMGVIASKIDSNYQFLVSQATINPKYLAEIQNLQQNLAVATGLNSSYVIDEFTPLLNLALMLNYSGISKESGVVAERYLADYENDSNWAKHLSAVTKIAVKTTEKKYLAVDGIRVSDTIKTVLDKWGKSDGYFSVSPGEELWSYGSRGVKLSIENDRVKKITLDSRNSVKTENGIGVGSSRSFIEKIAGRHKAVKSGYYIYKGEQDFAVIYSKNTAKAVLLFQ